VLLPFEPEITSKMKALRPLTATEKKEFKYAVFDIESRNWIDFELLGFFDGNKYREFDSVDEFLDFYLSRRYEFWRLFAHAGGRFDFNFILEALKDRSEFDYEILSSQGITQMRITKGSKYGGKSFRHAWILKDSYKMLPMSLAKLCNAFETEHRKLEMDYSKIDKNDEKVRQYLKNDVLGLFEVIEKYGMWLAQYGVPLQTTIASQSMMMFRRTLLKPIRCLKPEVEMFARRSYFGGHTEIYNMRSYGKIYYFDINSLYPSQMLKNEMPVGKGWSVKNFVEGEIGFYKADVRIPDIYVPPVPKVINHKLMFPFGKFSGFYTSKELELARDVGGEFDIHYGYIFSSENIFGEYISDMYNKKKNAKDSTTRSIAKLLMNANYGKFGQNRDKEMLVKICNMKDAVGLTPYNIDNALFTKENFSRATFIIPTIASWITSCARVEEYRLLQKAGENDLFYCDTDSVATTKRLSVDNELGGLKMEEEADEAIFLLPKVYALRKGDNVIIRAKGFDREFVKKLSFNSFEKALEGDVSDFKQQLKKFASMRESLRSNGTFVSMINKTKSIKARYDKRQILPDFNTKAWELKE